MNKEEAIKELIDDEVEAIEGYEKHLDLFEGEQKALIEKIIDDEKRHIAELKGMKDKEIFGI